MLFIEHFDDAFADFFGISTRFSNKFQSLLLSIFRLGKHGKEASK